MSDKLMIDYPALTMYQMVERTVKEYPDDAAIEFYGKYITYKELMKRIER